MIQNWPLPNLKVFDFKPNKDLENRNWKHPNEFPIGEVGFPPQFDFPHGWGNPWPDLPDPDETYQEFDLTKINLKNKRVPCENADLLGYYMSWHIIGVSFQNEYGRAPNSGDELRAYNNSLPEVNRFGIHICCKTIDNYIKRFYTQGLSEDQIDQYLHYCTYLTMLYVIAHEWGHYRSEILSFQINKLMKSVTGEDDTPITPSYLNYFVFKKTFPVTNFEEVFAEWASLKFGVFNYYMKKPAFAKKIPNWPIIEATVRFMLTEAISRPNRNRPYSDIRHWVDFDKLSSPEIMTRLSNNSKSVNRSVNDSVVIEDIQSLKSGKIIDLLMHNQMQFAPNRRFNGIVKSAPLAYPYYPDSSFYHLGDDDCLDMNEVHGYSEKYLRLGNPNFTNPQDALNSRIRKVIKEFKNPKQEMANLPIKVFPEILPLDPVYFHT